ncbi:MAG: methyltransferase [Clostridia bacterium]|nr:methyltransferase [Clostridia bacterium]
MQEPILGADERLDEVNENIRLIQRKNGLTFGSDAFLLSAFCRPAPRGRAADFGCGTGIISLLLAARRTFAHITAVEAQASFVVLAARNVTLNGFSHTVSILSRDVRDLTPADFGGELDVVIANPPYMRADSGFASPHNEKQIARHEILGTVHDFAAAAARCLKYGGKFYTVYRPDRLDSLFAALRAHKLAPKRMVFVHDHADKEPAMVLTESVLGAAEGLSILPPLILHEKTPNGVEKALSPRAQEIYDTGRF